MADAGERRGFHFGVVFIGVFQVVRVGRQRGASQAEFEIAWEMT